MQSKYNTKWAHGLNHTKRLILKDYKPYKNQLSIGKGMRGINLQHQWWRSLVSLCHSSVLEHVPTWQLTFPNNGIKLFQRFQTFIKVEGLFLHFHLAIERRKIGGTESKEVHITVRVAGNYVANGKKGWE